MTRTVRPCSAIVTARWSAVGDTKGDSITTSAPCPRPRGIRPSSTDSVAGSMLAMTSNIRRSWRYPVAGGSSSYPERANHRQRDAVAGADVVLGDRGGCAQRDIQARGAAVDPVALADVIERVDEQHDVSIVIEPTSR